MASFQQILIWRLALAFACSALNVAASSESRILRDVSFHSGATSTFDMRLRHDVARVTSVELHGLHYSGEIQLALVDHDGRRHLLVGKTNGEFTGQTYIIVDSGGEDWQASLPVPPSGAYNQYFEPSASSNLLRTRLTDIRAQAGFWSFWISAPGSPQWDAGRIESVTINYESAREFCAAEGDMCHCEGDVSYGANSHFAQKTADGTVLCSNENFGDPTPGTLKACYCKRRIADFNSLFDFRRDLPDARSVEVLPSTSDTNPLTSVGIISLAVLGSVLIALAAVFTVRQRASRQHAEALDAVPPEMRAAQMYIV